VAAMVPCCGKVLASLPEFSPLAVFSFRGARAFNREVREGIAKVAKKSKIGIWTLPFCLGY
jgi:hypothetical protein